ncbi:MAG: tetratricopeptide repeat protein [Phycisphaerales bacterium]|nr:MAG: tetratricopeptide repeat protein [Phycisphaerales bacterium]
MRALALLAMAGLVGTGFLCVRLLQHSEEQPPEIEHPNQQTSDQVILPVYGPLRTEQEVAALRAREIELTDAMLHDFPDSAKAFALTGNLYYRHGDAIEATKLWNKALEMDPQQADLYGNMGWSSLKQGDLEEAIAHYRKALEIRPQFPEAYANIGRALMMAGRHEEAVEAIEKEIQISPGSSFAHFLLGQVLLQQKEYVRAKEHYEAALKVEPRHANAVYGLATVCAKLGQRDEAKQYSAHFRKLKTEARQDLKGRKADYDDFSETQKHAAITYINVGRMYRDHGQAARAEQLLKEAAGLDPNNVMSYLELASLYQVGRQPAKALQMHRRIVAIQPNSRICHFMIGILCAHFQQFEDAEEAFGRVIALAPKKSDGYRELARLYLKTGRKLPQARQLAEKALALEVNAANYFILGWACYATGDMKNASRLVEKAMALDPGNANYPRLYQLIQQRKAN